MLEVVTVAEAQRIIAENVSLRTEKEMTPLEDAAGRYAAQDILSPEDLPAFNRSTVDGLAVHADDTFGCSEPLPAMLEYAGRILMGEDEKRTLKKGACMDIPTGGQLPEGADAVVMVEYTEDLGDEFRYALKPAAPNENVNRKGDDCKTGDVVVSAGTYLEPRNIAVLAAVGIDKLPTVKPLRVGIISTGDELIPYSQHPHGSEIRNINTVTLASAAEKLGCAAISYPVVKDVKEDLMEAVKKAKDECDFIVLSGGSSVGERDNVADVLSYYGEMKFHGVALKPGKPTMFAMLGNVPCIGLPGHPAAAFYTFHLFAKPAILKMMGARGRSQTAPAVLSQKLPSNHGREEIMAVHLKDGKAYPLPAKSGVVSVLSEADGFVTVPRDAEGLSKDTVVEVNLF